MADFNGLTNFIEGSVRRPANGAALGEVETASGIIRCVLPDNAVHGDRVLVVVRPEDMNLVANQGKPETDNIIEGRILTSLFMGDSTEYRIAIQDTSQRMKLHSSIAVAEGDIVYIELPPERCRALMA